MNFIYLKLEHYETSQRIKNKKKIVIVHRHFSAKKGKKIRKNKETCDKKKAKMMKKTIIV